MVHHGFTSDNIVEIIIIIIIFLFFCAGKCLQSQHKMHTHVQTQQIKMSGEEDINQ